ncbi:MAG: hypothetical protein SF162_20740 [bacterium]|nr:hypothetical protein [bacterium]
MTRLEALLIGTARKYAPMLVPVGWAGAGDYFRYTGKSLPECARLLAAHGAVVVFGDLSPAVQQHDLYLKDWVDQWLRLHALFADALFPTHRQIDAYLLDRDAPQAILIAANAMPVTSAVAEIAMPFVTYMNGRPPAEAHVLSGVIDAMLRHVEANCERPLAERLQLQGGVILRLLLDSAVRTLSPIPFVTDVTVPAPLINVDDSERLTLADQDTDSVSMSVTRPDTFTRTEVINVPPPTLPEWDSLPPAAPPPPGFVPPRVPFAARPPTEKGDGRGTSAPLPPPKKG